MRLTLAAAALSLLAPAWAGNGRPDDAGGSANIENSNRHIYRREITTDASLASGKSFDFVIVGGGVAGLALAARLSEWPNNTVLAIEAGSDGNDVEDQIDVPGQSYLNSLTGPGSTHDWAYTTVSQANSGGVTKAWPRGKVLGGSGAVNGMFWCRASKPEYDAWATLNPGGNQTWNWEEVNKYIMKAETFTAPPGATQTQFGMVLDDDVHGSSGPIQAGFSQYIYPVISNWIPTWVNMGFKAMDLAGGDNHGVMITPSTINTYNQSRSDSKAGYIDPLPPRANLVILTGQQVTKIIWSNVTDASGNLVASGVQFAANAGGDHYGVEAKKEVILAGGTIGSAQLLQLSGIGPTSVLADAGVPLRKDLPVGYNLQDHQASAIFFETKGNVETWYSFAMDKSKWPAALSEWRESATGLWTYINEAVGYVSMSDISGDAMRANTFANSIDVAQTVADVTATHNLPASVQSGLTAQYNIMKSWLTSTVGQLEIIMHLWGPTATSLGFQVAIQHPFSRGTCFINSDSAFDKPRIDPSYFAVAADAQIAQLGSLWVRQLAAATPMNSVLGAETVPGAAITGDALTKWYTDGAKTEYHPMGTCAMLPESDGGVVDTRLVVYGTGNVRVIDASIIPIQISAHLMATAYGIAEKGADIIKSEYMKPPPSPSATASSGDAASTDDSATATIGDATDSAIAAAGFNANNGLSSTAKTGIGIGVGVGAGLLLAALAFFCCIRRRKTKKAEAGEKGWYNNGNQDQSAWDANAAYREQEHFPLGAVPQRPFSTSGSISTMATADLRGNGNHSRTESGFGSPAMPPRDMSDYALGDYSRGGASSPYRDLDDSNHSGYATPNFQPAHHAQQYTPVQPR